MNRNIERGQMIVQKAHELYIDVDVEADGIAGCGSLLSIGAVDPWGEGFYRELRPNDANGFLPGHRAFNNEHGLEHERLRDEGMEPARAMREFAEWAQASRERHQKLGVMVLVGFNNSYDFPLIDLEYARAGEDNPFGHAGYCIKSLAMALQLKKPWQYSWKQTGKSRLPAEVLPDGDFTHHALDDARYQQQVHYGLAGLLSYQIDHKPADAWY